MPDKLIPQVLHKLAGDGKIMRLLKKQGTATFTFIGDSITWGLNFCNNEQTYVACFARKMAEAFRNVGVIRYDGIAADEASPLIRYDAKVLSDGSEGTLHVIRSGVGGNTVLRALARKRDFTGILPSKTRSDYIFTMFGINDALRSDKSKYVSPAEFKENYRTLIDVLKRDTPNAEIFIMTATTNDQNINAHVAATHELIREEKLGIIDLNALWNAHYDKTSENFGHGDWLANDACHPTYEAAEAMANEIFEKITEDNYEKSNYVQL